MVRDALIMLPGTLCDERVFSPVLTRAGVTGHSIALAGAQSAPEMAGRILAAAPQRFALCGFSLGAIVALEVYAQAPDRVTRLALIGANARAMPAETAAARRAAVAAAESSGTASYITWCWDASVPGHRRDDAGLRGELEAMARSTSLADFRDQIEISVNRRDQRPALANVAVPTLILCGTEDRVCRPELSREIAAAVPHARLAIIEGAGHYATLDQPAAVARELRAWLAAPANFRTHSFSKEMS